jgi:hypothetical protein
MVNSINLLIRDLLLNHSSIYYWNTPSRGLSVVSVGGDYGYKELSEEGRRIQARVLEEYRKYYFILSCLLKKQPTDTIRTLERTDKVIVGIIEQHVTWYKNTQEAHAEFQKLFNTVGL